MGWRICVVLLWISIIWWLVEITNNPTSSIKETFDLQHSQNIILFSNYVTKPAMQKIVCMIMFIMKAGIIV